MELQINGEQRTVPAEIISVEALLTHLDIRKERVVVEHNLKILKRDDHLNTPIQDKDNLEIIKFVGGG